MAAAIEAAPAFPNLVCSKKTCLYQKFNVGTKSTESGADCELVEKLAKNAVQKARTTYK
jgi:hypothetical protein